jgi:hypothetical protein
MYTQPPHWEKIHLRTGKNPGSLLGPDTIHAGPRIRSRTTGRSPKSEPRKIPVLQQGPTLRRLWRSVNLCTIHIADLPFKSDRSAGSPVASEVRRSQHFLSSAFISLAKMTSPDFSFVVAKRYLERPIHILVSHRQRWDVILSYFRHGRTKIYPRHARFLVPPGFPSPTGTIICRRQKIFFAASSTVKHIGMTKFFCR